MLPKTLNGWISLAVFMGLAVMAAYMGTVGQAPPLWAVLLNAGLGYLGLFLKGSTPKLPPGAAAGLIALLALGLMLSAGCPGSTVPTKTTAGLMQATQTTSKALAATSAPVHTDCLAFGAKSEKYRICIADDLKRLTSYRDTIRPAARSAVAAAYAAIMIAREAGKDKSDYMAILKPGACAIILGLREWGHKLPNQGGGILPLLNSFSPLACEAPAGNALGVITALLPVAVDLVKWIVGLVGADAANLEKEIYAWITGAPADEVDALISTITAALPVSP